MRNSKKNEQGSAEWGEARFNLMITGTDAAEIMGTAYDVIKDNVTKKECRVRWFKEKLGFVTNKKPVPQIFLEHGTQHEPTARREFMKVMNEPKLDDCFDIGCVSFADMHPEMEDRWEHHLMGGSPDGIVYNKKEEFLALVEFKCPFARKIPEFGAGIPAYYHEQLNWYMLLTGVPVMFYVEYYCTRKHLNANKGKPELRTVKVYSSPERNKELYNCAIKMLNALAKHRPELRNAALEIMREKKEKREHVLKNKN